MRRKTKTKIAIILGFLAITFIACQSVQERLQEVSGELSLPNNTMLLASMIREGQGSQDVCFFTSLTELYGSNLSYETVRDFYTAYLLDKGWIQKFPSWQSEETLLFRHDDEYQLSISAVTSNNLIVEQFENVSGEELESYTTIYIVTITYADWIARKNCPAWEP